MPMSDILHDRLGLRELNLVSSIDQIRQILKVKSDLLLFLFPSILVEVWGGSAHQHLVLIVYSAIGE